MTRSKRPVPPLDAAALERLALRYVERFATTRGRLADYLTRKIRERGWEGAPADVAALAGRMADLGYVDDRAYAEAKAASLARRGMGATRVRQAFHAAHIDAEIGEDLAPDIADRAIEAALTFARRRRIGPFGDSLPDRPEREKQLGRMLRAGHSLELSRRIVAATTDIVSEDLV